MQEYFCHAKKPFEELGICIERVRAPATISLDVIIMYKIVFIKIEYLGMDMP